MLIRDVARVDDGGTPETESVAVNGKDAVYLSVLRIPGGNTIEIVDAVKRIVEGLHDLPPGMQAKVYFDQSTFVRGAYHGLKKELLQALVLISLVILLFLQSVRGTMIVSVAIPLSFAITLIVLYSTGQTLNAFTLGGLTLAMGRLVDDAVVVLEAIHRHQRMGMSTAEAALKGTNSVALPVLASTLTTMAVLLPVLLLAGLARKLFAPLAITVAVAMIASYFVSMAVTPGGVPLLPRARRARAVRQGRRGAHRSHRRRVRPHPSQGSALPCDRHRGFARPGLGRRMGRRAPSEHVLPRDRRVDGHALRAPGRRASRSRTPPRRWPTWVEPSRASCGEDTVEMSIANIGMPQNARAS